MGEKMGETVRLAVRADDLSIHTLKVGTRAAVAQWVRTDPAPFYSRSDASRREALACGVEDVGAGIDTTGRFLWHPQAE